MNKRLPKSRIPNEYELSSQPRRSKKRNSRKSISSNESWYKNDRDSHEPSEDEVPGMEYASVFWQQPRLPQVQPQPVHNGQRLFTAMSDPSVCGYSAVPVTYAMEPVSLPPMYRLYQPVVRSNYRPYRGRTTSSLIRMQNAPPCSSDTLVNGYSSLQENGWSHSTTVGYQNGDYASLPPTANIDSKDNSKELSSEQRRYSDPGLGPADLRTNLKNEDADSTDSSSSITTVGKSNKLFLTLIEQMTKIKETNNQLFKELHQAKSDLETVKSELNQFKQNVPSNYQPGMLSDIIKEIRDASRIKEEAMLSKIRLLIESQQFQRSTDIEYLKSELEKSKREKEENEERIDKLEKEVAALRLSLNSGSNSSSSNSSNSNNNSIGIGIDNREIAAYEMEKALRGGLQEVSRKLAGGHATKCVNAAVAARAVTPVNFEPRPYSPCVTITPVRTLIKPASTDPSSSAAGLRSTEVNHELLESRRSSSVASSSSGSSSSSLLDEGEQSSLESSIEGEEPLLKKENELPSNGFKPSVNSIGGGLGVSAASKAIKKNECDESGAEAITTEVLVGGDSVVSKDSCSTNILTSRVLTAPSRATYTTAYI